MFGPCLGYVWNIKINLTASKGMQTGARRRGIEEEKVGDGREEEAGGGEEVGGGGWEVGSDHAVRICESRAQARWV